MKTFPHLTLIADTRLDDRAGLAAAPGLNLAGASDGDLILAAYGKWGADCPRHLLGDYAFVIRDEAAGVLFGARDHIGARPFFYSFDGERFRFAGSLPLERLAGPVFCEMNLANASGSHPGFSAIDGSPDRAPPLTEREMRPMTKLFDTAEQIAAAPSPERRAWEAPRLISVVPVDRTQAGVASGPGEIGPYKPS